MHPPNRDTREADEGEGDSGEAVLRLCICHVREAEVDPSFLLLQTSTPLSRAHLSDEVTPRELIAVMADLALHPGTLNACSWACGV